MKKKLTMLRDIFVKLSRAYKDDFYLLNGEITMQGDVSFSRLPAVVLVTLNEEVSLLLEEFLNIPKGSLYHIESTDAIKNGIDDILTEFKDVLKLKTYDEDELLVTISDRLSSVYQPMEMTDDIKSRLKKIENTYESFYRKEYFSLDKSDDGYNEMITNLFENKIYSELRDLNPDGECPSVIITASLFPLLAKTNIDDFEYSCEKVYDDGTDILYNITSRMILDNFTIYVSYDYTDMSYTI